MYNFSYPEQDYDEVLKSDLKKLENLGFENDLNGSKFTQAKAKQFIE